MAVIRHITMLMTNANYDSFRFRPNVKCKCRLPVDPGTKQRAVDIHIFALFTILVVGFIHVFTKNSNQALSYLSAHFSLQLAEKGLQREPR